MCPRLRPPLNAERFRLYCANGVCASVVGLHCLISRLTLAGTVRQRVLLGTRLPLCREQAPPGSDERNLEIGNCKS
jgi:hypothetical protein